MVAIEHRTSSITTNATSSAIPAPLPDNTSSSVNLTESELEPVTVTVNNNINNNNDNDNDNGNGNDNNTSINTDSSTSSSSSTVHSNSNNNSVNSPTASTLSDSSTSTITISSVLPVTKMSAIPEKQTTPEQPAPESAASKSAVSQRQVDVKIGKKAKDKKDAVVAQDLSKKVLKFDLKGKETVEYVVKSPKSPIAARLPHQSSLTSSVDVEDRKTLREALYQGIFSRHRRTIFAVGSFLRMLRSRNSQYNTIRSSSEGDEPEEPR